jgi:hypothetical protein
MANQSLGFTDALALLASELGVVDDWQGQWQPTPPSPLLPYDEPAHPIPQWQGYTPIDGTPAERYLVGRGITLARLGLLTWPKALGYGIYASKSGKQHPALFSHYTNAQGETRAIQAVLLTRDGQKLPCDKPKQLLLGSKPNGSACRLWPRFDAEYSGENPVPLPITLALCEGVETALAFACYFARPAWASYSAQNLANVALFHQGQNLPLYDIEGKPTPAPINLWLAPDRDTAGIKAAYTALATYSESEEVASVKVITPQSLRLTQDDALDWCDLLASSPPADTPTVELRRYLANLAQWHKADARYEATFSDDWPEEKQAKAQLYFDALLEQQVVAYQCLTPLQKASTLQEIV